MKIGVVVTGLPASGKSTLARDLARKLRVKLLDKDTFLEALFEHRSVKTFEDRSLLSRESDQHFQTAAIQTQSAVLVSHWQPKHWQDASGTPTDWLSDHFDKLCEVFCECPLATAYARFLARDRHPSHLDKSQRPADLLTKFESWNRRYPLGFDNCIRVQTGLGPTTPATVNSVVTEILSL